jgi:hypothetical protein
MAQTTEADLDGWLTEEQVLAGTGVGRPTFERWRAKGLIPEARRQSLGRGLGTTRYLYPPMASAVVLRLAELRRERKGFDHWFWQLWLEGYPVNIVRNADDRLLHLHKLRLKLRDHPQLNEQLRRGVRRSATRADPHRSIFRHLRAPDGRRHLFKWALAVGVGGDALIDLTEESPSTDAFLKATGATELPDRELEFDKMSFERMRKILRSATVAELEQVRQDCRALQYLITLAEKIDWHRVRASLTLPRQGVPGGRSGPIAPFERLVSLWRSFDTRTCLIPFLIFVRRLPEYGSELDERLASMGIELQSLAETASIP